LEPEPEVQREAVAELPSYADADELPKLRVAGRENP
jgi:hypothetical protein